MEFPAPGKLDYGQSPRATPVIHGDKVYLLGAFGGLRCVELASGKVIWERQLPCEFKVPLPTWGMCSPPLIVDDLLIVNPGSANASLAALDCATGGTRWTSPGFPAAYSAFICVEFGGQRQIVGYDRHSLGGWDVKTGKRLWKLVPPTEGDFNVPTPVAVEDGIVVSTDAKTKKDPELSLALSNAVFQVFAFVVKMLGVIWVMFVARWAFPRFRYDQIMRLGWKLKLRVSLSNVVITAAVFLWAGRRASPGWASSSRSRSSSSSA